MKEVKFNNKIQNFRGFKIEIDLHLLNYSNQNLINNSSTNFCFRVYFIMTPYLINVFNSFKTTDEIEDFLKPFVAAFVEGMYISLDNTSENPFWGNAMSPYIPQL